MLDWIKSKFLFISAFLCISVFTYQYAEKIKRVASGEDTCLCAYDGYGYYAYLTQFIGKGDLFMTPDGLQVLQDRYCDSLSVYQLSKRENGNYIDVYHMGMAFIQIPAYLTGELSANLLDYERDGFSKPYHIAYLMNAWLFIVLGIIFCCRIFLLFFSDYLSSLLLFLTFFATNYYATAISSYELPHIYLFTLVAWLGYHFIQLYQNPLSKKHVLASAILLGLISVIRPTHVLLGLVPLFLLRKKYATQKQYWKRILFYLVVGFLFNLPQLLYWKLVGGSWLLLNLHVEEIIIIDPHLIDFLISYKKGWLLYSPLFLLLIPGFIRLFQLNRRFFWLIFLITLVFVWVFASWECWWYAASFGSRVMIDLYPILLVVVGLGIQWFSLKARIWKWGLGLILFLITFLSLFQSKQFLKGMLHTERMTKEHYWYIFGRLSIPDYNEGRLEIDRSNSDWVGYFSSREVPFAYVRQTTYLELKDLVVPANNHYLLDKRKIRPLVSSDETNLDVEVVYQQLDSLNPATIHFETFSSFNVYDWNSFALDVKKRVGETDTLRAQFNLPRLNHRNDKLQIYVVNFERENPVKILSLKVKANSLIRK